METNIIHPTGGLCNKIRVIFSYLHKYQKITVIWLINDYYQVKGKYLEFFEEIPQVNFEYKLINQPIIYKGCFPVGNYDLKKMIPKLEVKNKIISFLKTNNINDFNYYALHIRRTDLQNIYPDITSDKEFEDFVTVHSGIRIFLATDNSDTQEKFSKFPNIFFYHNILDNKSEHQHRNTDLEHSIMDLLICALSKKFKGTSKSSFSDIINQLILEGFTLNI